MEEACSFFFFKTPPTTTVVIFGRADYVPAANVQYKFSPILPFPCVLHDDRSHNHSTYGISVSLMSFFSPSTVLPPASPSHSSPHSTRASVEVLSRVCREIQTDRRVKRVSCRAAAAAAALLLRGCDLDNQEELERLQALEPLQLQQCQEGVSCITQCPIQFATHTRMDAYTYVSNGSLYHHRLLLYRLFACYQRDGWKEWVQHKCESVKGGILGPQFIRI